MQGFGDMSGVVDPPAGTNEPVVVVVTYNSARVIPGLLASAVDEIEAVGGRLVVVDNGSADGTPELVRSLAPVADVIETGCNAGYAVAINTALRHARPTGPVVILNPDTTLRPGSLARLLAGLDDPGVGAVVGRLDLPDGAVGPSLRREPTVLRALGEALLGHGLAGRWSALSETIIDPDVYTRRQDVDWATGAFLAIGPRCRAAVGEWDEQFFLYSEETDYLLRINDAGFVVRYLPDAAITHIGGESRTSPRLHALMQRNAVELHRKRHGSAAALLMQLVLILRSVLRLVLNPAFHAWAIRALLEPQPRAIARAGGVLVSSRDLRTTADRPARG